MPSIQDAVRGSSAGLDLHELLRQPTTELIGVSRDAGTALASVGIRTIFDLGASRLFLMAVSALTDVTRILPVDAAPGDLVSDAAGAVSFDVVSALPLSALRSLSSADAAALTDALSVRSIRDLALWPPYVAARKLVGTIVGGDNDDIDHQSDELRPRFGVYPTERTYYSTLVLLETLGATAGAMPEVTGPVSIDGIAVGLSGAARPAIGALLTISQSWFSQGVTLGQMLHSLALAPGEATRIAMIDWTRRSSATASEDITEGEQLASDVGHTRALSEVQNAVATDLEQGGSTSSSFARSHSEADGWAASSGFGLGFLGSASGGGSSQDADSFSSASSFAWSLGSKSVVASLAQDVNDRTEQHSSSVRSRRATAIREVSQEEHEQVSTRIVANYNHMHALTVQYYEVVQIYRTIARLHNADRCFFLPLELIDFSIPSSWHYVERFRATLMSAALSSRIRDLLSDDTTTVNITPVAPVKFEGWLPPMKRRKAPNTPLDSTPTTPTPASKLLLWRGDELASAAHIIDRPLIRRGSDSLHVPSDVDLLAIAFDGADVSAVRLDRLSGIGGGPVTVQVSGETQSVELAGPIPLTDVSALLVKRTTDGSQSGTMTLTCSYLGRRLTLPAIPLSLSAGTSFQKVATLTSDQGNRRAETLAHLQSYRDYYSAAIFRSLDALTISRLLAAYKWNGRPLIEQVEPRPVTVAGNYMVLRAPVGDEEGSGITRQGVAVPWKAYRLEHGIDFAVAGDERLVPIPTGGVFGEAVLGRSNSAEKLDITRFWNWQDSPIPFAPPEIAAVQTGSRATDENLAPGALSSPVLNIVNPTTLPDSSRIDAVLGALAGMNFRDMSGLAGTQTLASSGMAGTLAAATEAGKLNSQNIATEAQKAVAMGQIAADLVKSMITASAGLPSVASGSKDAGISAKGAEINHARSMDERGITAPPGDGTLAGSSIPGPGYSVGRGMYPDYMSESTGLPAATLRALGSREVAYSDAASLGFSPAAVSAVGTLSSGMMAGAIASGVAPVPGSLLNSVKKGLAGFGEAVDQLEGMRTKLDIAQGVLRGKALDWAREAKGAIDLTADKLEAAKKIAAMLKEGVKLGELAIAIRSTQSVTEAWERDPENIDKAIQWQRQTARFLSGLKSFVPESIPLREMVTGLFDAVTTYTDAVADQLSKYIKRIDKASQGSNIVYYSQEVLGCENGYVTDADVTLIKALDGLSDDERVTLFYFTCKHGGRALRAILLELPELAVEVSDG